MYAFNSPNFSKFWVLYVTATCARNSRLSCSDVYIIIIYYMDVWFYYIIFIISLSISRENITLQAEQENQSWYLAGQAL